MADPQIRADQSPLVVHLTRKYNGESPMDNLLSMIASRCIEARTVNCLFVHTMKSMGFSTVLQNKFRTVSFTETPILSIRHLVDPTIDRKIKLASYGIVFSKLFLEERLAGSVHYINALHDSSERDHWLSDFRAAFGKKKTYKDLDKSSRDIMIQKYAKIDVRHSSHDFAWEREWRHVGDLEFVYRDVVAIICPHPLRLRNLAKRSLPKKQFDQFEMLQVIDADWSMEEVIEHHARRLRQLELKLGATKKLPLPHR